MTAERFVTNTSIYLEELKMSPYIWRVKQKQPRQMNTEVTIREEFQPQVARFDEYQITSMAEDMDVSASRHNGCVITSEDGDATIEATVFFKKSANTYCYGGFVMTEGNADEQPALVELMKKLNA